MGSSLETKANMMNNKFPFYVELKGPCTVVPLVVRYIPRMVGIWGPNGQSILG